MTLQRAGIDALERELRDVSPYPGLRPFSSDEARYFMGRETQIFEIIGRLARESCVTVLGGSGCGKSSIVRAGVIPALLLKLIPGRGDFWRVATCTPGRAPIDNLIASLERVLVPGPSAGRSTRIREVLYGPDGLGGFLPAFKNEIDIDPSLSADVLEGANILAVIDQFEELFREENRGRAQAAALAQLVIDCWRRREQYPGLFLVLAMRTDDLHRCAEFIDLPDVINATGYLTRRLKEDELREAIVAPVRPPLFRAGLLEGALAPGETDLRPYEVQVVTELLDAVEEIGYDPDHLPLLQHLLAILWRTALERWRREADQGSAEAEARITEADLARALGFNTWDDLVKARERAYADNRRGWLLRHCLQYVADELYQGGLFGAPLTPAQRDIARTGFCLMGEVDDRGNFKRRWTTREEIARVAGLQAPGPDVDAFIRRFTQDHRLLWVRENGDMDVSHEALMRNWSRLAGWLTENKDAGEAYRRLVERYDHSRQAGQAKFWWWLSCLQLSGKSGFLSADDLDRIEPLLTSPRIRLGSIEPRYNSFWSERFVPSVDRMSTLPAADRDKLKNGNLRDKTFNNRFIYLKRSRRCNSFRGLLPAASFASILVLIAIGVTLFAWMYSKNLERDLADANVRIAQDKKFAVQQANLLKTTRESAAASLWRGLEGRQPVPGAAYVKNLWEVTLSDEDVRIEFVRQIPPGNIARQMGFRPQPITRAVGLLWPDEAQTIVSDILGDAVAQGDLEDLFTLFGLACAVAALEEFLDEDTRGNLLAKFEKKLGQVSRSDSLEIATLWSSARSVACLGDRLGRETRDALLKRIFDSIAEFDAIAEQVPPRSTSIELSQDVSMATIAAWEAKTDGGQPNLNDLNVFRGAIHVAIDGLRRPTRYSAVSLPRSLVSLIAALPGDNQDAALAELLSAVNNLPEANPDVLLILAQAFELLTEQHSSAEGAKERQPLTDRAETLLAGPDTKFGIARLIAPLAQGRPGMLENLLQIAEVAAPADPVGSLLAALSGVGGESELAAPDDGKPRADGLRIGLQGRLLALVLARGEEGRGKNPANAVSKLSHTIEHVGRTVEGEPVLPEPQQHFAREGLARAFAALAPSLDQEQRDTALTAAKGALAITGSAEEAAAWATAITNLLAEKEDGDAVAEIVEILKYPTAALTAREPNASEPRNATDILAQALAQRLKLPPVEPLHPTDLQVLLDRAEDLFHVGLETRPTKPTPPAI